ncbi:MAG: hypothetical protein S4CHLAM81_05250 [Chlamydiales bacterium]|nr:hypothetical protein [Chlamydiales bacterium]MCH9704214.1 hypothetical protein [Chlamydiota bacterium]
MYRHFLLIASLFLLPLNGADNTFLDSQNYNHGYCPDCNTSPCDCPAVPYKSCPQKEGTCPDAPVYNPDVKACYPDDENSACTEQCPPCDPCAPIARKHSGISICAVGLVLVALAAGAAVIVTSNNGSSSGN